MLKDYFGRELKVGDRIAYLSHSRNSSSLNESTVAGFTRCFVVIEETNWAGNGLKVSPEKTIKKELT